MVASAAGAATAAPPLTPATAQPWVASWERAQDRAVAARQERSSAVVALVDREVARAATRCAVPVVLELGAGTGTLARRIAQRSPGARVVALEDDPVLLAVARAVCAGDPGVEVVAGSVGAPGWLERLGHVDVVVASGVLHRLRPSALATLYRELAGTLPAGGVLVDADELLRSTRSAAVRRPGGADPADEWWRAAARAPELVGAFAARGVAAAQRDHDNLLSAPEHSRVLLDLGFGRAHEVWRSGPSAVLAAWR